MKDVILTAEGYEKLKQEIEYLSNDKRREVAAPRGSMKFKILEIKAA